MVVDVEGVPTLVDSAVIKCAWCKHGQMPPSDAMSIPGSQPTTHYSINTLDDGCWRRRARASESMSERGNPR